MGKKEYYARFARDVLKDGKEVTRWQLLEEHLENVAALAQRLAEEAGADPSKSREAWCAGLLHDIGKVGPFQDRIRALEKGERAHSAKHSFVGAHIAHELSSGVSLAVMGHHSGIPNDSDLDDGSLGEQDRRILRSVSENDFFKTVQSRLDPGIEEQAPEAGKWASRDLWIRMLFSCLVDADRTDSARFEYGSDYLSSVKLDAASLIAKLRDHVDELSQEAERTEVNKFRARVFEGCIAAGSMDGRLFSLTVPTGGGKTLASMAFALARAAAFPEEIRRIIVVIPYLSIIEQNARIYKKIFGEDVVLEHHSGDLDQTETKETSHAARQEDVLSAPSAPGHVLQLLKENWDAPIIVTTSVRFFESLFSNRPGDLRRAHNIARSVVVFDEVQTFHRNLIAPILSMIKGLADEWKTTFLFCTATQPAFEYAKGWEDKKRWKPGTVIPVMPLEETKQMFGELQRVPDPPWPRESMSWARLAELLLGEQRVLCIVNTKGHAAELFRKVRELAAARDGGRRACSGGGTGARTRGVRGNRSAKRLRAREAVGPASGAFAGDPGRIPAPDQ